MCSVAISRNSIVALATGTGKTLIAVLIIRHFLQVVRNIGPTKRTCPPVSC